MTTIQTQAWFGQSGTEYAYDVYPVGIGLLKAPGNYIFAKQTPTGWIPVYIGQTGDLSARFDNHHKMFCIRANEATHIHVHSNYSGELVRKQEESDLVGRYRPACNGYN